MSSSLELSVHQTSHLKKRNLQWIRMYMSLWKIHYGVITDLNNYFRRKTFSKYLKIQKYILINMVPRFAGDVVLIENPNHKIGLKMKEN